MLQDYTSRELITITGKARHKKVETTLRYDHVSDDMVRDYFKRQFLGNAYNDNNGIFEVETGYF